MAGVGDGSGILLEPSSTGSSFLVGQIFLICLTLDLNFIFLSKFVQGLIEAVKVWEFLKKEESMLTKFKALYPGECLF